MIQRTLLLVDDEENILRSVKRTLRRDGYDILTANSGEMGLDVLEKHEVGVIVSDQRMPGMIGAEFLSKARERYPDTVRIMLSGYTELNSVTDAINQGAIYKFLTKPWEDDLLRANVKEAFEYYELRRENERLNEQLTKVNQNLEKRVEERSREAMLSMRSLQVAHDVLEQLPVAVVGVDADSFIVSANELARKLLDSGDRGLIGRLAKEALPDSINVLIGTTQNMTGDSGEFTFAGETIQVHCSELGGDGAHRGFILVGLGRFQN